jgi:hypothetical protein
MTLAQTYVFLLYFSSLAFVLSAAVVNNGLGLSTDGSCRTAIIICLTFYAGSKLSMWVYAFSPLHSLEHTYGHMLIFPID